MIRAKIDCSIVHPEFVQFYTMTTNGQKWLSGRASNAADGKFNINTQILKNVLLPLPTHIEQCKIIESIKTMDKKIEAEIKLRDALHVIFRALLDNLMTGKIRVNHLEMVQ